MQQKAYLHSKAKEHNPVKNKKQTQKIPLTLKI